MCSSTFHRARARACLYVCFAFVFLFFFAPPTPTPLRSYPPPFPVRLSVGLGGSSALLFYSLAAAGQLINQIFKQCFSAQWEVLDYLWLLAVPGTATHYQPPTAILLARHTLNLSLTYSFTHSLSVGLCAVFPKSFSHILRSIPCFTPSHHHYHPPRPQIVASRTLSLYNCSFSHRLPDSATRPLKELSSLCLFFFCSFSSFSPSPRSSKGQGCASPPRGSPSQTDYHSVSAQLSCGPRCL